MSDLFPTPSPADWRVLAEKALKDRPLEGLVHLDADGLAVRPLYAAVSGGGPVFAPRPSDADGRAWDVRTLIEGDDPAGVNAAALADLEGGAASILLKGAILSESEPLSRALDDVALELAAVGLDADLDGPDAANALAVAAKGSPRAKLMFHMDPLSAFAEAGASPRAIDEHLMLAANTAARHAGAYPEASFFLASGRVVHEAGGSIGQELGFVAANAVALVRAAVAAGVTAEAALKGTVLGVSVSGVFRRSGQGAGAAADVADPDAGVRRGDAGGDRSAVVAADAGGARSVAQSAAADGGRLRRRGRRGGRGGAGWTVARQRALGRLRPAAGAQYAGGADGRGPSGPGR